MQRYRFESAWHVPAPAPRVWAVVVRVEDWPRWWPAVTATREVEPGDADGVGRVVEYLLRAPLGYRLAVVTRVVEAVAPERVRVEVVGQLAGEGLWTLHAEPGGTRIDQVWDVAATRPWMRRLAPVAAPAFRWSHDRAARRGGEGLADWVSRTQS